MAECKKSFNHIGIVGDGELARLVGYHEDLMDCYYHIRYMNRAGRDKNDCYFSMVGAFISLKGIDRYKWLDGRPLRNPPVGCVRTEIMRHGWT